MALNAITMEDQKSLKDYSAAEKIYVCITDVLPDASGRVARPPGGRLGRKPQSSPAEVEGLQAAASPAKRPRLQRQEPPPEQQPQEQLRAARAELQELRRTLEAEREAHRAALRASEERHQETLAAARREKAMALAAPLPFPSHYSEFSIDRLPADDPVHGLLAELFVGSAESHRKERNSQEFCPAPQLEVLAIDAVVNPRLAKLYHAKAEEIQGLREGRCSEIPALAHLKILPRKGGAPSWPELNEHFLFHGATKDKVAEICRGGFDPRRGGEGVGRMFGFASYLAPNSSKADIYTESWTSRLQKQEERQVIVARALLGESHRALARMPDATRPPDGADGRPLDSVWAERRQDGGAVDHREVMVYEKGQACPEFIISYRHRPGCACAECCKRP